jgi:ABC-type bacteriocin/lantibiotic exporter with double-glycine peptidase domain
MQSNDRVAKLLSGRLATAALNAVMIVFYFILMLRYNVALA